MSEKSCLYKKRWKLFKWKDKYKISALFSISCLAEIKYSESPLIVTFKDVGIFFKYGFSDFFFDIYTFWNRRRPF